ncbi:MAG: transketolase C-terminal domain-containing protein, partial [Clostridia bacterium]
TDATMLAKILPQIINWNEPSYIRLQRKNAETVYDDSDIFDITKAKLVKDGKDATIVASGIMVAKAVEASKILAQQGLDIAVLNTFTWKPIDEDAIVLCAKKTKAVVVAENHNRINGLFYAVADVLARKCPTVMESVAVQDMYGQVGKMPFLAEAYGLTTQDIVNATLNAIKRK